MSLSLRDNFIIHQRARQYQWSGDCFLSIKSFYNGSARYEVKQRQYLVNDSNYLILNDCTRYNLVIDNDQLTESFCVFFSPAFVASAVSELNSTEEQLLDFSIQKTEGLHLVERNYIHGDDVSGILLRSKKLSSTETSELEREEFYHLLLNRIILKNRRSLQESEKLMARKRSTREEIYRRLFFAKDFIDSSYTENLKLKDIADVSMLSENHLLRNFNKLFGFSPFQYITKLKINEAKRRIIETDKSITEIAVSLGYSSMSNFSFFFKKVVGASPVQLRRKGDM